MIEELNSHVEDLQRRKNDIVEIRNLLQNLERYADVYVDAPSNSPQFTINVVADEPTGDLISLSEVMGHGTDIVYQPESDSYKLHGGYNARV